MKTIAKSLAILAVLVITQAANAQRVMSDPSYSINNYKHPNKAAYMKKKQDAQPVVYLEEVKDENTATENESGLNSSANYKGMSASKSKTKTFRVSNSPSAKPFHLAPSYNGNYKQQFQPRQKKQEEPKNDEQGVTPIANN